MDARLDEMAEVLRQIWRRLEESESKVDELQKQLQDVDSHRDEWVFHQVHELRREAWTDSHRSSQATLARLHAAEAALQRLQGQSEMVTGMLSTRGRVYPATNPAFSPTEPSGFQAPALGRPSAYEEFERRYGYAVNVPPYYPPRSTPRVQEVETRSHQPHQAHPNPDEGMP